MNLHILSKSYLIALLLGMAWSGPLFANNIFINKDVLITSEVKKDLY